MKKVLSLFLSIILVTSALFALPLTSYADEDDTETPEVVTIAKLTAGMKSFTAKWYPVEGVSGYQLQYSTRSIFTDAKTVTIKATDEIDDGDDTDETEQEEIETDGEGMISKSIKMLSANKKYYVRLRTYKLTDGKKIYSVWSSAKTIVTKGSDSEEEADECEHTPLPAVIEKMNPATCVTEGSYDRVVYCKDCGEVISRETVKIPMMSHTPIADKAAPATFKADGKTAGAHCLICGKVIAEQTVIPKLASPKLSKVNKNKKAFTATWEKVDGIDGYQIQYSTNKAFKKGKISGTKTVNIKASAAKMKIKKLKSGKKYFVRIRAYKTIGDKKQYSKWSAKKAVKTK